MISQTRLKELLTYVLILPAISLLTGCGPTTALFSLNSPNDTEAIVTFIRPYLTPTAFAIEIFVDGEKAAKLSNRSSVSFSVPAGDHEIVLDWPKGSLVVGGIKVKHTYNGADVKYFLINDKSTIVAETLLNGNRLYLTELTKEEGQRFVILK